MTSTGTKSGRGTSPARASRAARNARPDRVAVRRAYRLGIGTGMALSLLITAVAFFTTRPDPAAARLAATGTSTGQDAHAGHNQNASQQAGASSGAPAAAIDVNVTNLGNLQISIEATVSVPKTYDPITMADVAATTDMMDMPMSHTSGPIVLAELPGRPGVYQAVATVPMLGRYDVTVDVRKPMAAQAHKRITISSVAATRP